MKKQKARPNHIARPNHAGGYIEWHKKVYNDFELRESVNLPTNDLFDAKIKLMIENGLTKDEGGEKDAKIIVFNANGTEGVISVTMEAKKAYKLFNLAV